MAPILALYPGQGSQSPGMALDFYQASTQVKELFALASEAAHTDLYQLLSTATEQELKQTRNAQLAITLSSRRRSHLHPKGGTSHGLGRAGGRNDRHPRRMRQPTSAGPLLGGETGPGARGAGEHLKGERASGHPLLDDAQRVFDRRSGRPRPRLGSRPKKKSRLIIQKSKT